MNLITVYAVGSDEKIQLTQRQARALQLYQVSHKAVSEMNSPSKYFSEVLEGYYQSLRKACICSRTNKLPAQFAVDVFNGKRWQN